MKLTVVAAVLLTVGCTTRVAGPDAPEPTSDGPTREQLLQVDGLCWVSLDLERQLEAGRDLVSGSAGEQGNDASHYLSFVYSTVSNMITELGHLSDTGIEAADRYVADLRAELGRIKPELGRLGGAAGLSEAQRVDRVRQIVELFESMDPAPDARALARENPEFAAVYELAPSCEPLAPPSSSPAPTSTPASTPRNVPPSEAKDGTDVAACADGTCQVAVTGSVTVTVGSFTIEVTVAGGQVTTVENFPGGGSGSSTLGGLGGAVSFGTTEETVTISLVGIDGDTAVLDFSLS